MLEFTGERVVPGEVEPDLWNEHVSRYHFASRFASGRTVADLGCGTGYGSAILAQQAAQVHGFDLSPEAISWAADRYRLPNLAFAPADCCSVPLGDGSAGLVVAFELIEHLEHPTGLLREARRILAHDGLFCVSTPNAAYYAASRGATGPNPFHAREFHFAEFHALLAEFFPHVATLAQNHAPAVCFQPVEKHLPGIAHIESATPGEAHFFVAVCARHSLPQIAPFVYVPQAGNVLREREQHIARLEQEVHQKQTWLDRALADHAALVEAHRQLHAELEKANAWAKSRDAELEQAIAWAKSRDAEFAEKSAHVQKLLEEAKQDQETISALAHRLKAVEAELLTRTRWALTLESELKEKSGELLRMLELLHAAEADRDERTRWALSLDAQLAAAAQSRWLRFGRLLGLGPKLNP